MSEIIVAVFVGYMTIAEAAAKTEMTERRIQQLCAAGLIPGARKFGRSWMVPSTFRWTPKKRGRKPR
jgi:hypothetical protein